MLIEWTIKEWYVTFLLINLKEADQQVDPNTDGGTVCGDIRKCKIRNWEQRSKNREDWMRSVKEAKAHIGLQSQLRRRRRRRSSRRRRSVEIRRVARNTHVFTACTVKQSSAVVTEHIQTIGNCI
jgi:hypothetical protein